MADSVRTTIILHLLLRDGLALGANALLPIVNRCSLVSNAGPFNSRLRLETANRQLDYFHPSRHLPKSHTTDTQRLTNSPIAICMNYNYSKVPLNNQAEGSCCRNDADDDG